MVMHTHYHVPSLPGPRPRYARHARARIHADRIATRPRCRIRCGARCASANATRSATWCRATAFGAADPRRRGRRRSQKLGRFPRNFSRTTRPCIRAMSGRWTGSRDGFDRWSGRQDQPRRAARSRRRMTRTRAPATRPGARPASRRWSSRAGPCSPTPLFLDQVEGLAVQVERLKARDPAGPETRTQPSGSRRS